MNTIAPTGPAELHARYLPVWARAVAGADTGRSLLAATLPAERGVTVLVGKVMYVTPALQPDLAEGADMARSDCRNHYSRKVRLPRGRPAPSPYTCTHAFGYAGQDPR